ncbi:helix-turn-helix domain-containing protein [Streptomyces sp. BK79]|uniref:helix-turn-helix domain-containing protein n=1 Tax=Streptomyces sp. BK79 TaxID=3350097 RepID=UPI0037703C18
MGAWDTVPGRVGSYEDGGPVSAQDDGDGIDEVAGFAALLRALKEGTDRSYGSLARRLGMNTSTLHRYCAGEAVPLDFAPVERFAALCGATAEQRLELHRRWLQAVAARHRPRTAGAARSAPPPAPAPTPPLPPARRAWYRRRRLVAGLASVCAVLATLGALSALPDGRRAPADGAARDTGPTASGTASGRAEAGAPERRSASPGPSDSTASERPSGSAPPKEKPGTSHPPRATPAPTRREQPAGLPLTWSVNSQAWKLGCGHDYVIAKPPGQVPPPPAPQDAAPWAATQSAVHGGETLVQLSVQGRSDTAVVLEALRVRVVGRTAPAEGNAYAMDQGCGGSITPRYFAVDLDKDRPLARAVAGSDSGTPIPAVRMPYRVSAKDPEVLLVTAGTSSCDCRWYLELDWSSQGQKGTVRIDDEGRPFRTSGIEGLPRYTYDTLQRRWGPYS